MTAEEYLQKIFGDYQSPTYSKTTVKEPVLTAEVLADAFLYALTNEGVNQEELTGMVSEAFLIIQEELEAKRKKRMSVLESEEERLTAKLEKIKTQKEELI